MNKNRNRTFMSDQVDTIEKRVKKRHARKKRKVGNSRSNNRYNRANNRYNSANPKTNDEPIVLKKGDIKIQSLVQLTDGTIGVVTELTNEYNNEYRLLMDHSKRLEYHPLDNIKKIIKTDSAYQYEQVDRSKPFDNCEQCNHFDHRVSFADPNLALFKNDKMGSELFSALAPSEDNHQIRTFFLDNNNNDISNNNNNESDPIGIRVTINGHYGTIIELDGDNAIVDLDYTDDIVTLPFYLLKIVD